MVGLGMGIGGSLSSGGRQLIRFATMGLVFGGVGMAGYGYYAYQDPRAAAGLEWIKANTALIIAVGVGAIVLGAMLSWWSRHQMMKQMTAGMGGMGMGPMGMQGMPNLGAMGLGGMGAEVVKVRCPSCGSLQAEEAEFCSKCGKAMKAAPKETS